MFKNNLYLWYSCFSSCLVFSIGTVRKFSNYILNIKNSIKHCDNWVILSRAEGIMPKFMEPFKFFTFSFRIWFYVIISMLFFDKVILSTFPLLSNWPLDLNHSKQQYWKQNNEMVLTVLFIYIIIIVLRSESLVRCHPLGRWTKTQ